MCDFIMCTLVKCPSCFVIISCSCSTCKTYLNRKHAVCDLYLQPDVYPGQCWAMSGDKGYVVISLAATIHVNEFSLEHIPKSLAPDGDIKSAPRDFSVWVRLEFSLKLTCAKKQLTVSDGFFMYNTLRLQFYRAWKIYKIILEQVLATIRTRSQEIPFNTSKSR